MAVDPTSDAALAELTEALPALRPELHRYCSRMTGSVIDGEDVLQETLLSACRALQSGTDVRELRPWLFRIAHNTALNLLRSKGRDRALREAAAREIREPFEVSMPDTVTDSLRSFLRLTPRQRSAVILRDVLGYSASEVADLTGSSVEAVKSTLHRGRVVLAEANDDNDAPLSPDDHRKLADYAACFNAHEFDRLRDLLAAEVRLELVARERRLGKAEVGDYFGNYSRRDDWLMAPGRVERRPAILAFDRNDPEGDPVYFILLDYDGSEVSAIRDFRYARYAMADAAWERL